MSKKAKKVAVACLAVSILYIFFAVRPLRKEIHFLTRWTIDCTKPDKNIAESEQQNLIPFKLGQIAGYFTPDGKLASLFTFPYKATLSRHEYALYSTGGRAIRIFSSLGEQTGEIEASGFPFFQDDRKYLMLPGGQSFAVLSDEGKIIWDFENYAPITAFSTSDSGIAAGYADGSILVFDNNGKIQQQLVPGGSEYDVILGLALSQDGSLTASICGQNNQRFILARKEKGLTAIIYHEYLEAPTNRQVIVKFSKDSSHCYFAHKDCLGVMDIKKSETKHIPIKGSILSIQETEKAVFVLSKHNGKYYVSIIQNHISYSGNFSFKAENAFIAIEDNSLFVGKDSSISRIDIEEK